MSVSGKGPEVRGRWGFGVTVLLLPLVSTPFLSLTDKGPRARSSDRSQGPCPRGLTSVSYLLKRESPPSPSSPDASYRPSAPTLLLLPLKSRVETSASCQYQDYESEFRSGLHSFFCSFLLPYKVFTLTTLNHSSQIN